MNDHQTLFFLLCIAVETTYGVVAMRTKLPIVSILIPLYNHSAFIEKTLDSIVDDGYSKVEVIVIDDGSSDNSFEVARNWRERNPGHFRSFQLHMQENQGVSRTLNKLVRLANGAYVCLLASDDYLLKGGIEARVTALENNSQWLAVMGDCLVVDHVGNVISDSGVCGFFEHSARKEALLDSKFIGIELVTRWSVPGPVYAMRKDCFDIIGFFDESVVVEDYDLVLRLLCKEALGFVDYKVACYRLHDQNSVKNLQSAQVFESMLTGHLKALKQSKGLLKLALFLKYQAMFAGGPTWRSSSGLEKVGGFARSAMLKLGYAALETIRIVRLQARQQ
jgi:glycosyltransferase involved in cell wall biosynthesis